MSIQHYLTKNPFLTSTLLLCLTFLLTLCFLALLVRAAAGDSNVLIEIRNEERAKLVEIHQSTIHTVTITNDLGEQNVSIHLAAEVASVSLEGNPSNWKVLFKFHDEYTNNMTLGVGETGIVEIEIFPSDDGLPGQSATIHITGYDAYLPLSGPMNHTRTLQNSQENTEIVITTTIGHDFLPNIEIASGSDRRKQVNPITSTSFMINISNAGFKSDSFRLTTTVGNPTRGETRTDGTWNITFSPSSFVQELNSITTGVGHYAFIYVNVTAPNTAIYGDYPLTITATSVNGNEDDSLKLHAVVPIPDLYLNTNDIVFCRFPVIDSQELTINITIRNMGGAVEESFAVDFWIEDSQKSGNYNIVGSTVVDFIASHGEGYASVVITPELSPKVLDTLTSVGMRITIDPVSEIVESNEDNNQVDSNLDIMKIGPSAAKQEPVVDITHPDDNEAVQGIINIRGKASHKDASITIDMIEGPFGQNDFYSEIKEIERGPISLQIAYFILKDEQGIIVPGGSGYVKDVYGLNFDLPTTTVSFQDNDRNGEISVGDVFLFKALENGGLAENGYTLELPVGYVEKVEISIDGRAWVTVDGNEEWSFWWNTTREKDGKYSIDVRAFDGLDYSNINHISVRVNNNGTYKDDNFDLFRFIVRILLLVVILGVITIIFNLVKERPQ